MRTDLPQGAVTLLFTDVEGSTRLLHELGPQRYSEALGAHRRTLRRSFTTLSGVEVDTQGDAFFVAFPSASLAVEAAADAARALGEGPIRVRMGLHTGTPHLSDEGYIGADVHLGARIGAAGHGGQVLMSKATRELVDVKVTDLGEHRLKDFDEPVWIFQLGSDRFPPLKTISNTNLPRPVSSFVGRESEVTEVVSLITGDARLITLTGPGGTGKTRLSIESAGEVVSEFRNGVFWTELAPLRDPGLVLEAIAQTLGAKDGLAEHISEREMLLVLDNFEQVIDAAPEIASLLEACPNLKVLVTSRGSLRVRGEVEFPVPPLADLEAVELFATRSGATADVTVEKLCRSLDNLPLALELAAARVGVLDPSEILARLDHRLDLLKGGRDADPRQATLRALIDWSFELLTGEEKELFRRLAVFRGGCTLEAAEQVADADLDVLQGLVDKSLVRRNGDRYWMLETIRDYAIEGLEASVERDRTYEEHAGFFVALAAEAQPHLREIALQGPGPWLDRLRGEVDNFRAALDHLEATGQHDRALRLAGDIAEFWYQDGYINEGRERVGSLLKATTLPLVRARALIGACDFAAAQGDLDAAVAYAREAVDLYRGSADRQGLADATWRHGSVLGATGLWDDSIPIIEEAIAMFAELNDQHALVAATRNLAFARENLGDLEGCRRLHETNLERARSVGNRLMEAITLGALAMNSVKAGRPEEALPLLHRNLPIFVELGDRYYLAEDLCRVACAVGALGDHATAVKLIASAEAVMEELGMHRTWVHEMNEKTLAAIRDEAGEERLNAWSREGHLLNERSAIELAREAVGSGAV